LSELFSFDIRLVFKSKVSLKDCWSRGDREQTNPIPPSRNCHHSSNEVVPGDEQRNSQLSIRWR